jgi:hypothetical protein
MYNVCVDVGKNKLSFLVGYPSKMGILRECSGEREREMVI